MSLLMDYLITRRDRKVERWDAQAFNEWRKWNNKPLVHSPDERLRQLKEYTGLDIIDWEMEDR